MKRNWIKLCFVIYDSNQLFTINNLHSFGGGASAPNTLPCLRAWLLLPIPINSVFLYQYQRPHGTPVLFLLCLLQTVVVQPSVKCGKRTLKLFHWNHVFPTSSCCTCWLFVFIVKLFNLLFFSFATGYIHSGEIDFQILSVGPSLLMIIDAVYSIFI